MLVPSMGEWLYEINFSLLGEFGYYFPFALFILNYLYYKRGYELQNFTRRELFGFVFALFACVLLFAIFYPDDGFVLQMFYTASSTLFGYIGSGIMGILLLLFSLVLLFPNFIKEVFKFQLDFTKLEKLENRIKNSLMQIFGGENDKDDIEHNEPKAPIIIPKTTQKNEDKIDDLDKKDSKVHILESKNSTLKEENSHIMQEIQMLNIKSSKNSKIDLDSFKNYILNQKNDSNLNLTKENSKEPAEKTQSFIYENSSEVKNFAQKASRISINLDEDFNFILEKEVDMIPERFLKPKKIEDFKELQTKENLDTPSYKRKNIAIEMTNNEVKPKIFNKELELREELMQKAKLEQEYKEYEKQIKAQKEREEFEKADIPIIQSSKYNIENTKNLQTEEKIDENLDLKQENSEKPEILDFNENDFKPKSVEELRDNHLDFVPIVEEVDTPLAPEIPIIKMSEFQTQPNLKTDEKDLTKTLTIQNQEPNLKTEEQQEILPENQEEFKFQSPQTFKSREIAINQNLLREIEQGEPEIPKDFNLPPLEFLTSANSQKQEINESEIDKKIYDLLEKLRRFKIGGDVINTYTGPVVTTFEFRPSADVKVSRILNLQDDLAMALKAKSIRIQAPIPGKDVVGIEVPNEKIQTIYLREILESEVFKNAKSSLTIALGKDIVGNAFVTDLKKLPHLLIAGTTGSGKSVGINSMLLSLLYRNSPKTLRLMMIDPKMLEFSIYNDIPHLLTPVITDPKKAINALSNMVAEMERRYRLMAEAKTKNIENYNEKIKELGGEELPFIVVIIDELADLMMNGGKDVEFYIARLAQMARASGIHLIVATQRPSVDVVTGLIKANLPSRISYKVGQKIDSKVILDTMGAESLLGRGDCLFTPPATSNIIRLHAPYASEFEIEKVVDFLKAQQDVVYDESFLKDEQNASLNGNDFQNNGELDELYEDAKRVILEDQKTSISYLQRRLKIGYNRAANIIEQLSENGVLSKPDSKGQREILG